MTLGIIILAAGQGTRMRSELPKVLHRIAGRPLLAHVATAARTLNPAGTVVVFGHGGQRVPQALAGLDVQWVEQAERLGTAHAVAQALPLLSGVERVLVLYGDVPLISPTTLQGLLAVAEDTALGLLTMRLDDPSGYGRVIRAPAGRIERIVEEKDAADAERSICEVNTGIMVAHRASLERWIRAIDNANSQGEYYLTDVVGLAAGEGIEIHATPVSDPFEVMGVNDRVQLAALERHLQARQAEALMRRGVTLADPSRFDLRGELQVGRDVEIDVNVILEGSVELGNAVRIGPNTLVRDSRIGDGVEILANCVIEHAVIGAGSRIGPYTRLRPEAELGERVHVGNFVEIKKSTVGAGSKINHLSYVGDASVGREVNVGAGTITCNYDGANKHRTVIGDQAFIGSDSQLVAPITIGAGATIGAGSTITRDAPDGELTLSRVRQQTVQGWTRPKKLPK